MTGAEVKKELKAIEDKLADARREHDKALISLYSSCPHKWKKMSSAYSRDHVCNYCKSYKSTGK